MLTGIHDIPVDELSERLEIVKREKGARKKRNEVDLIDIVCAFDIETSTVTIENEQHAFMYIWQFQLGPEYTITGRTWEEFADLLEVLRRIQMNVKHRLKLTGLPYFVCYIHNLAFEWQFLQGRFHFENDDCFFRDVRKPIYCRLEKLIEFRCSYLHSNMSLAKFAENVGCKVRKLSGDKYDYSIVRYPWTKLTQYEMDYCTHDVITLEEAIRTELHRDGDTLRNIPLTSTGYVRRDCKAALKPIRYSIEQILPDRETYNLLRRCFRGGNTHANRMRVNQMQGAGHSVDIASSYPTQQLTKLFPTGPFHKLDVNNENLLPRILKLIKAGNAVIADYCFKGLRLMDPKEPVPYLPTAKCQLLNAETDNGRVLSADMCVCGLTEIDLSIVMDQYEFYSVRVFNAMTAIKGPLPKAYKEVVLKYYELKTKLKDVEGREYEYIKSKNKLNSVYGMSAQQPIHPIVRYDENEPDLYLMYLPDEEKADKELKAASFPYQWGVYTTAYARLQLHQGMKCVGKDKNGISNIIYCDTDSIKYVCDADFTQINKRLAQEAKKAGAVFKDPKGIPHPIGVFTQEPDFKRFITHGAKRYAYEDLKGKLHITVSGVTKKPHIYYDENGNEIKSVPYAVEELGPAGIENFKEGMIWREAGGTAAVYNDHDDIDYTDPATGRTVHIGPNVAIVNSTYTLMYTDDYRQLIDDCILWVKFCNEKGGKYK